MSKLNDFAPYPTYDRDAEKVVPEVTADNLARNMAVFAQSQITAVDLLSVDHTEEGKRQYRDRVSILMQTFGVAFLLRALGEETSQGMADEVAGNLWECWQDGVSVHELLWEWLTEYGIDPAEVSKVAAEAWKGNQGREAALSG
jgi:hypothetical protein